MLRKFFSFKTLRWLLALLLLILAAGLAWVGWKSGSALAWFFTVFVLLSIPPVIVGSWIISWLVRRAGRRVWRDRKAASRQLMDAGLEQGGDLVRAGTGRLEKNMQQAAQELSRARSRLDRDLRGGPANVTWVRTQAPGSQPSFCSACGQAIRTGANFCPRCGRPILPSA